MMFYKSSTSTAAKLRILRRARGNFQMKTDFQYVKTLLFNQHLKMGYVRIIDIIDLGQIRVNCETRRGKVERNESEKHKKVEQRI